MWRVFRTGLTRARAVTLKRDIRNRGQRARRVKEKPSNTWRVDVRD